MIFYRAGEFFYAILETIKFNILKSILLNHINLTRPSQFNTMRSILHNHINLTLLSQFNTFKSILT